jgi:hypothetical protein
MSLLEKAANKKESVEKEESWEKARKPDNLL